MKERRKKQRNKERKKERKKEKPWDFPGGPVVTTPCFHCRGVGLIPGQGTRNLHAACMAKKKKKEKEINKVRQRRLNLQKIQKSSQRGGRQSRERRYLLSLPSSMHSVVGRITPPPHPISLAQRCPCSNSWTL